MAELKAYLVVGDNVSRIDGKKVVNFPRDWLKRKDKDKIGLATLYADSPWARRCIAIRSYGIAGTKWEITINDKPVKDDRHSPVWILNTVNDEMNYQDLMRATESDMLIWGQAAWLKVKSGDEGSGKVIGLMRLNGGTVKVKATKAGIEKFIQTLDGKEKSFDRGDIVYFHDYHPTDDFGGQSPTATARLSIEIEISANKYLAAFFEHGAIPAYIVTTEQKIPVAELRRRKRLWDRMFKGEGKQHKTAFVDQGLTVKVISFDIQKLALKNTREEARKDICAAYGVPPAIVGAWEAANYASSKEQRRSLYTETIIPRGQYIEGVINGELMTEFDSSPKFRFKFEELPVMQPDQAREAERKRFDAERVMFLVQAGIITSQDAAEELGYEQVNSKALSIKAELRKFRRKALKRLKENGSGACTFTSKTLTPTLISAIEGGLQACKTIDDVDRVFDSAQRAWSNYP